MVVVGVGLPRDGEGGGVDEGCYCETVEGEAGGG